MNKKSQIVSFPVYVKKDGYIEIYNISNKNDAGLQVINLYFNEIIDVDDLLFNSDINSVYAGWMELNSRTEKLCLSFK